MKKIFFILSVLFSCHLFAQPAATDSLKKSKITVLKDDRIDKLGKKMTEYNESLANKIHLEKGYRLMLLSTTDRAEAIRIRSKLMQQFPGQNVYMTFQSPYIKLKFGDFTEKDQAEDMRKDIIALKIVSGNIYIVGEMVEVRPEKNKQANTEDNK